MAWYEWLLSILLFIISLGALITIHEAGHLSMAKLFKVYCHEFSIGFGPKILKVRKHGHETYFSIRAIPLGGYVSMYGEEGQEIEEFKNIPTERSLEGIKKWKKAIILLAGVILNAFLALILILVSDVAFPKRTPTRSVSITPDSIAAKAGIVNDENIKFIYPTSMEVDGSIAPFSYEYTTEDKVIHAGYFFIVDTDIQMIPDSDPGHYHNFVLTFYFNGNKDNSVFTDGIKLYPAIKSSELESNQFVSAVFKEWNDSTSEWHPEFYPDFTQTSYKPSENTKFDLDLQFQNGQDAEITTKSLEMKTKQVDGSYVFEDIGLSFKIVDTWLPIGERFKQTFVDYGNAAGAVFKGLGVLFTGGIRNMSGIVGIFETSASLLTDYTFATYLYFWGLISVNLAIFNLLPFPGLDGWQLLVTIIEGITRKKIPSKFKSIMSAIGLLLLFVLMIFIVIFDVGRIVG